MDYNYPGSGNPPLPPGPLNPPPPPPPPQMPMGMNQMMQQGPMMGGPMNMMSQQNFHNMPMQMMQGLNTGMSGNLHQQAMHAMMGNPGLNDAPLEFNMNKNKPPMPIVVEDRNNGRGSDQNNDENGGTSDPDNNRRDRDRRGRGDRRDRDRDRRDRDPDREQRRDNRDRRDDRDEQNVIGPQMPQHNVVNNMQQQMAPNMNNSPNAMASAVMSGNNMWGGMMGPMGYPMMGMNLMGGGVNMMGDPNMMGMTGQMGQYGMMPGMMADGSMGPMLAPDGSVIPMDPAMQNMMIGTIVKEKIKCKSCILFPPKPNTPQPTTRERPPGCRTVFVGGLPETTTEEIIDEIFSRCGEMSTVRLSKKNFCHIRFVYESSVEAAIYLSGYHVRIGDDETEGNPANSSRLHVDYAQARDDLYEWECRQRALQREMRHRERVEKERMRPPSPPPVVHYTEHEAANISEKLKVADESFTKAVQVVITWLDRGDCVKRNANTFYTMIQSTNSHIRRLLNEKAQFEEELQRARDIFKGRMQGILIQFGQIERVFSSASHKKVWDHFTKAQRKNIEMWKKQTAEIKTIQLEEVLNERADEEMEVSDSEDDYYGGNKKRRVETADEKALASIKEENDSLRCQLEAYKNEVDLVRVDSNTELDQKDKQIKMLQQTLQGMQQQLMDSKRRQTDDDVRLRALEAKLRASDQVHSAQMAAAAAAAAAVTAASKTEKAGDNVEAGTEAGAGDTATVTTVLPPMTEETVVDDKIDLLDMASPKLLSVGTINDKEARLIGLISTFLNVHPFGAGVDYIWSYVQKMEPLLRPNEVESLMNRFPLVFRETLSGIGANMERRWQFSGFEV